jgi:hypothetical protein
VDHREYWGIGFGDPHDADRERRRRHVQLRRGGLVRDGVTHVTNGKFDITF